MFILASRFSTTDGSMMNSSEYPSVSLAKISGATCGRCAETETKKSLMIPASLSGGSWQSRLAKGFESGSLNRRGGGPSYVTAPL